MDQRVSLVTLGVADVASARAFYEGLGWVGESPDGDVVFHQAGGMVVALWSRAKLAADSTVVDGGGWGGVTLAYNVGNPEEVDGVLEQARAAGGRIGRPGAPTAWGGYSGVFIDPDGHPWEVAHNPGWDLGPSGEARLHGSTDTADDTVPQPRPLGQRKADSLAMLEGRHADIWVATSQAGGVHLVPLSFAWTGNRIVLVTEKRSRTATSISATGRARLALGPTRDVVVVDAEVDQITSYSAAHQDLVAAYLAQSDWDPAQAAGDFVMIVLRPVRIQAWREANEIPGRVVMHDGDWRT